MDTPKQPAPGEYVTLAALERSAVLPSRSSAEWVIKQHRHELIECGALLPGRGRAGSVVHREIFPRKVIEIRRRQALDQDGHK